MHVQVFVLSPSATPQCWPKWIVVHLYKVNTSYVYTTSVRPWPSIKTKSSVGFSWNSVCECSTQSCQATVSWKSISDADTWLNDARELLPALSELLCRSGWKWEQTMFAKDWTAGVSFVKTGAVEAAFFLTESTKFFLSSLHCQMSIKFGSGDVQSNHV